MIVSMLAGLGHRLRHLLRAAGLAKSTYYHLLSHPAAVTRPDLEPMVAEIFARTPNGCGHRQIRMCLVHEFGVRVSHKSVLKVMRRMGLECRIRRPNPYRKYSSYRDETGARAENLLNRDFTADRPWVKLGTDVTEFRVADGKVYFVKSVFRVRGGDVFLDSLTGRRTSSWRSTAGSSATEPWTCTSNTNAAPPT